MLEVMDHKIIAIRKNDSSKIHIKYMKDGEGKSICGSFDNHEGFIVDNLEDGEQNLQVILEDKDICQKCLKPIKRNIRIFQNGLTYALEILWVEQSWNHKETGLIKEVLKEDHRVTLVVADGTPQRAFSKLNGLELMLIDFDDLETEQERNKIQNKINELSNNSFPVKIIYQEKNHNIFKKIDIDEFEREVKNWYIKHNINLAETWFEVETQGLWKNKRVRLINKIPFQSYQGLFEYISDTSETYEECFKNILDVLAYWDVNKSKTENKECIETFCKVLDIGY